MSRNAPQLPTNSSTADAISVTSSAGFSAGDLIYYKDGDYGTIPNTGVTSAAFNCTATLGITNGATGGEANMVGTFGGSRSRNSQAVLTNGNIVQVYMKYSTTQMYFRIVDTSNTVVVSETSVSATYTQNSYPNVCVAALSGGGFVVGWINSSGGTPNYPCYAIYSNTGSVVTAAFQDTSVGTTPTAITPFIVVAQPNGGFIGSYFTSTGYNLVTRTYNSTGTATAVWLTVVTGMSSGYPYGFDIAVRSDSTFVAVWTDATNGRYAVISATNSTITTATYSSTAGPDGVYQTSACTLTGDTVVIGYASYTSSSALYSWAFRTLSSGNVLSSETALPTTGLLRTQTYGTTVRAIDSGTKFIFVFADVTYQYKYCVYTSALALQTGPAPQSIYSSWAFQYVTPTVIDYTGYIQVSWLQTYYGNDPRSQSYCRISKTGYGVTPFGTSVTATIGTVSASVNGYSKSGSTPTKAAFLAANTETLAATGTVTSSLSPTVIEAVAVNSLDIATFPDGRFAIAYMVSSTLAIKVVVYSQSGTVLTTITTPAACYDNTTFASVRVTTLTSNKLVVGVRTASGSITSYVYGTDYSLLYTSAALTSVQISGQNYTFDMCGISNDRYVLMYTNSSSYPAYVVYSNATAILAGPTNAYGATVFSNISCEATNTGWAWQGYYNGGANYAFNVVETTTNTFSTSPPVGISGGAASSYGASISASPNGSVVSIGGSDATNSRVEALTTSNVNGFYTSLFTTSGGSTTYWMYDTAITASGTGVVVQMDGQLASPARLYCFPMSMWGQTSYSSFPAGTYLTLTGLSVASTNNSSSSPMPKMTPLYGSKVVLTWKNNLNQPCFSFIDTAYPWAYQVPLTSGVTSSAGTVLNPATTGYVFKGVSASAASAGGSGLVQTNGNAQLNSSYSASTAAQGFDYQQPNGTAIDGVKGTIVGRNVTLTGNN